MDRNVRRLKKLMEYREKVNNMDRVHLVEHSFYDNSIDHAPVFIGDKDKICHGLDASGDLSGGFAKVKEGLLMEIDFEIAGIKDVLSPKKPRKLSVRNCFSVFLADFKASRKK